MENPLDIQDLKGRKTQTGDSHIQHTVIILGKAIQQQWLVGMMQLHFANGLAL
jgi:hypothetical protein